VHRIEVSPDRLHVFHPQFWLLIHAVAPRPC
jgi:hypothetical protein